MALRGCLPSFTKAWPSQRAMVLFCARQGLAAALFGSQSPLGPGKAPPILCTPCIREQEYVQYLSASWQSCTLRKTQRPKKQLFSLVPIPMSPQFDTLCKSPPRRTQTESTMDSGSLPLGIHRGHSISASYAVPSQQVDFHWPFKCQLSRSMQDRNLASCIKIQLKNNSMGNTRLEEKF